MNNKNIKVLHIISSLEQGGAERQLVELVKRNNNHAICQLFGKNIFETDCSATSSCFFSEIVMSGQCDCVRVFLENCRHVSDFSERHSPFSERLASAVQLIIIWNFIFLGILE